MIDSTKIISLKYLGVSVMLMMTAGCVIHQPPSPGDPHYAPVTSVDHQPAPISEGSLYRSEFGLSLFDDRKAHRIGDIITVELNERTVSKKSAGVSVDKESTLGVSGELAGQVPTFNGNQVNTSFTNSREFSGDADADQSNSLNGSISVTVVGRLPNGNLEIRGEKWITLNRGDEFIRISGIIRPEDVSQENSVPSTKLANARISYSGTGELADSQSMGWASRFFNNPLWPF